MWVRKSEEEIQEHLNREEAKRTSLGRPLLFALILTAVAMILYLFGYRGGSMRSGVVIVSTPGVSILGTFIAGALLFTIFFAFFVYRQRRRGLYSPHDSVICRDCKEPSQANPSGVCQCGGTLEPFAFFTWTEDATQADH